MNRDEDKSFDRAVNPFLREVLSSDSAQAIARYRAEDSLRERIEQLASKRNEGELTGSERAEYEGYVRANNFVAILQATARRLLAEKQL